jgi:PEP-CTERM motif
MRRTLWLLSVVALLVLLVAAPSRADTVYTYTGADFTTFDNPSMLPTGVVSLDGSVTLTTSLGDNFSGFVTPEAFSFSDGPTTITQLNEASQYDSFYFVTNSSGAIVGWDVELCAVGPACLTPVVYFETVNLTSMGTDDYGFYSNGSGDWGLAVNSGTPGAWTGPITTPEPSALLLLGSGLLGLFGVKSRKSRP